MIKIGVKFAKKGEMRFISHLDLLRLFQRAARRAGLPVSLTEGFNKHYKISIKRALKLGFESDSEEAVFCLNEPVSLGHFSESLNKEFPEGVKVNHVEAIQTDHY